MISRFFSSLVCFLLFPCLVAAQSDHNCAPPNLDTAVAPVTGAGPVEVQFAFFFNDILGISDVDQNMEADIAEVLEWTDPRLKDKAGCYLPYTSVWTPRLALLNSSRVTPKYAMALNRVQVLEGGRVRYVQRYIGSISTYHALDRFPFDSQVFKFQFLSPYHSSSEVRFVPNPKQMGIGKKLNIEDWTFGGITASAQDDSLPLYEAPHSVVTLEVSGQRYVRFYIFKVLVPLFLIVAMSWVVFWIPPDKFETQIGFAATSMLTLIAFQFGMINSVPKLSYFTSMDLLVFGSTVMVFAAMIEALLSALMMRNGFKTATRRIEITARWLFPFITTSFWLIIIFLR